MATMTSARYHALRGAGAADDDARKAAEEVAGYENRFAKIESERTLIKWLAGFNLAMAAAVLVKPIA